MARPGRLPDADAWERRVIERLDALERRDRSSPADPRIAARQAGLETYSPIWYGVDNSSGVLVGRYFFVAADLMFLNITMRVGPDTVPSGSFAFSLPPGFAAPANIYQNLHAWAFDDSEFEFFHALSPIRENPGSWTDVVEVIEADDSFNAHNYSGLWYTDNRPFVWATDDVLCIHGWLIVEPIPD